MSVPLCIRWSMCTCCIHITLDTVPLPDSCVRDHSGTTAIVTPSAHRHPLMSFETPTLKTDTITMTDNVNEPTDLINILPVLPV